MKVCSIGKDFVVSCYGEPTFSSNFDRDVLSMPEKQIEGGGEVRAEPGQHQEIEPAGRSQRGKDIERERNLRIDVYDNNRQG